MAMFRRPQVPASPPPVVVPSGLPHCAFCLPALIEFLSLDVWDDGKRRVPGSLSLFRQEGVFKLAINDKDTGLSAFLAAVEPADLFMLAEGALQEGTLQWRTSYSARKKDGKKQ